MLCIQKYIGGAVRGDTEKIGERLKQAREQLNLSQGPFASSIGVSINTISNWERGVAHPPADKLALIREKYGIDLNWLLTGEGLMTGGQSRTSPAYGILNGDKLRHVMKIVEEGLTKHGKALDLDRKTRLIVLLYEYPMESGGKQVDPELVDKYLELIG